MKRGTVFYKMSGSGNDFIMVDGRYIRPESFTPAAVVAACRRQLGIGADGVILLDPHAPKGVHFIFHFWNSDGSLGPMCGNGALCAVRLATLLELAPADGEVRFQTAAGIHRGRVFNHSTEKGTEQRAEIYLPDCAKPVPVQISGLEPGEGPAMFANPSVPHVVLQVQDLEAIGLEHRGPPLRNDPGLPPGGANINWISPVGDGSWRMRTYERGVEGETLACGTGAVACALVLGAAGKADKRVRLWTRSGKPLDIAWEANGTNMTSIRLAGEARVTFRGTAEDFLTAS